MVSNLHELDSKMVRVAALERMDNIIQGDKPNIRIEKVTPKVLDDCFGVFFGDQEAQKVVLKVYGNQVKYIRSLPLHTSQYRPKPPPSTPYSATISAQPTISSRSCSGIGIP